MKQKSGELLDQLGRSRAQHVSRFAEIAVWAKGKRDEVVVAEDADECGDFGRLNRDFRRLTSFEHLCRSLDRLQHDTELRTDDVDVERSVRLRIAVDGDAFEVHQKACKAPFSPVDDLLEDGLKHGGRR